MTHFLARLAARASGERPALAPRPRLRFEPAADAPPVPSWPVPSRAPLLPPPGEARGEGEERTALGDAPPAPPSPAAAPTPLAPSRIPAFSQTPAEQDEPSPGEAPRPAAVADGRPPAAVLHHSADPGAPADEPASRPGLLPTAPGVPDPLARHEPPGAVPVTDRPVARGLGPLPTAPSPAPPSAARALGARAAVPELGASERPAGAAPASAPAPPPEVVVQIDRIEVRAPSPPPPPAAPPARPAPPLTLDAYLARRSAGR